MFSCILSIFGEKRVCVDTLLGCHLYSVWPLNIAHLDDMSSSANEMPINALGLPAGDHDEQSGWICYMREHSVRDWLMCYAGFLHMR